ncbi:MAG: glycine zipper 2TM domain-containing protein [Acidimicrobiales bacterium]|nr:glycine zipper 2TM domain-containing protein [Hyphomonadaceae bacterium]RZV40931.1 MAG: glycine zipper 2TM domain-containing protein [Acidimicrobiales bacterium]
MTRSIKKPGLAAVACVGLMAALGSPAYAQSTEEVVGAVIGGGAGAYVGGELDNKGSKTEGRIIGGLVGGALGYVVGGALEGDRDVARRHAGGPGEYYQQDGKAFRRYRDDQYGIVSFPIGDRDPYYYRDGRKKAHPVFAVHPGQGKGKGLYKNKHKTKHKSKNKHRNDYYD